MLPITWRRIMATNGDRSSMPMLGSTRRRGARIGSVMSRRKRMMGLSLPGGTNHEKMARRKMAAVNT